jgi:hypothetical protein
LSNHENNINNEIKDIWKALTNLDKADVQTAALCHAIVAMLIDKGIGSQEEIAKEMEKSIPKVMAVRKEIVDAIVDPYAITNKATKKETIH